jgi:predicted DNA-binding transcriptional regulator YafY
MKPITRQWQILRMISRRPGKRTTAREIYETLLAAEPATGLTKRTIERDLHELAASFPIQRDGNKPQGWSWRRDADSLDVAGMDITVALTFRMVEEYLARLLPQSCLTSLAPHMARAKTILGKPGEEGLADWPAKVKVVPRTQPLIPPDIDPEVLDVVYGALLANRRFKGIYQRQGERGKELEINPLGLVFNDPAVYVVGTCWHYRDVRLLALHRFANAELLDISVNRPPDFDLQAYIDGGALGFAGQPGKTIQLKARFTEQAASHLRESPLAQDQNIEDENDGWVVLQCTVPDTQQLLWWLRGFGDQVEVLEPISLREKIVKSLQRQSDLYGLNDTVAAKGNGG